MTKNAKLDALILENIGDIEAAIKRATEYLDTRLWEEMAARTRTIVERHGWLGTYNADENNISFAPREWHDEDDSDDPSFYFEIDEIVGVSGSPHTYISEALANNPYGATLGLYFRQNIFTTKKMIDISINNKLAFIQNLKDQGFTFVDRDIYITIIFKANELVAAYGGDDFDTALSSLEFVVNKALDNRLNFDELVKSFRETAKKGS